MTWPLRSLQASDRSASDQKRLRGPARRRPNSRQHRDGPQWPRIAATRRRNARRQKRSLLDAALDHKSSAARKRSSARAATHVNMLRDLLRSRTTRVKEIFFSPLRSTVGPPDRGTIIEKVNDPASALLSTTLCNVSSLAFTAHVCCLDTCVDNPSNATQYPYRRHHTRSHFSHVSHITTPPPAPPRRTLTRPNIPSASHAHHAPAC